MNLVKMQLACLSVLILITYNYFFESYHYKINLCTRRSLFELNHLRMHMTNFQQILRLGFLYIIFDIISVFTVNDPELVHTLLNYIVHVFFYVLWT